MEIAAFLLGCEAGNLPSLLNSAWEIARRGRVHEIRFLGLEMCENRNLPSVFSVAFCEARGVICFPLNLRPLISACEFWKSPPFPQKTAGRRLGSARGYLQSRLHVL